MIHFNIWLVYFYVYCILGWCFESGNVSLRKREWTNRGFMRGPWLPIYGSGALVILLSTLHVDDRPWLVFITGAFAATLLEYVTGVVMLAVFKVRYWDYRYHKIQFQGHICLVSTMAWGVLSVVMVYGIHPYIEKAVNMLNADVVNIITFLVTICITYDFANSLRNALDVRKLIIQAEEIRDKLARVVEEERRKVDSSLAEKRKRVDDSIAQKRKQVDDSIAGKREEIIQITEEFRKVFEEKKKATKGVWKNYRQDVVVELERLLGTIRKGDGDDA